MTLITRKRRNAVLDRLDGSWLSQIPRGATLTDVADRPVPNTEGRALAAPPPGSADLLSGPRSRVRALPWAQSGYVRAAGLFLAVRLFSVGVLAIMAAHSNRPLLDRLRSWDGWWYLHIAEANYTGVPHPVDISGHPFPEAPYGFFPLYPAFTELVGQLPGISLTAAGLIVSTVAGIAAACGLYRIGRLVSGSRVGLLLAVLWAGAPMAITESMVMTESLFTALAVWALVGVLERNWFLTAGATVFAGLTRSTASVLIAVVVVAAVIDAWRGRRRWLALTCAVVAPLGLLGYWGMVAVRTGSLTGWADVERRGWNVRPDPGIDTWRWVSRSLFSAGSAWETLVVLVTLAAVGLTVIVVAGRRVPWQLAAYAVGVVVLVVCTAGLPALKTRFLLPDFALLLPIAAGLAHRRTATMVTVAAVFVLVGAWYSAYGLTIWKYAI
ncbi:hypothetical protein [Amycolatopsis sp. NPDC051372]|uniref:hypothetical protein n=1 Tax=Amycolatopsis sp. NPDC051372 TaxID=3155669 RepID=UPI00343DF20C